MLDKVLGNFDYEFINYGIGKILYKGKYIYFII